MSEHLVKSLPLQNKRILVTRTREQAEVFSERLRALGALPVEFPTIRIVPPQDLEPLDIALHRLCMADQPDSYDWLIFTSANGVNFCFNRLRSLGYDLRAIDGVRIATIGPATAATLEHNGVTVDLVPGVYIAEGVAAALIDDAWQRGESLVGKRILLARAAGARRVLVTELQKAGAVVDEVAAYRTIAVESDDERGHEVLRLLQARQLDYITFTSSSTVRNFMQWLRHCEAGDADAFTRLLTQSQQPEIACIGPITSQTAREFGLDVQIEAKEFTIDGLVEAIIQHEEKAWQIRQ